MWNASRQSDQGKNRRKKPELLRCPWHVRQAPDWSLRWLRSLVTLFLVILPFMILPSLRILTECLLARCQSASLCLGRLWVGELTRVSAEAAAEALVVL